MARDFDAFHPRPFGRLDRAYLRQCAAYRLLRRRQIGAARAIEIMRARDVRRPGRMIELWRTGPLRDMRP